MVISLFIILLLLTALASGAPNCQDFGAGNKIIDIVSGSNHGCVLFKNAEMKCWGRNVRGALGQDNLVHVGSATPVGSISNIAFDEPIKLLVANYESTCAVFQSDKVKCWGYNEFGELGLGDKTSRGGSTGDMAKLNYLKLGDDVEDIQGIFSDTLAAHTCILFGMNKRKLKCWGWNQRGQLGRGDVENIGDESDEMGNNLKSIDLQTESLVHPDILLVAVGKDTNLVLLEGGILKGWGSNEYGILGPDVNNHIGDGPGEMGVNMPVIDVGVPEDGTFHDISVGSYHACLIYSTSTGTPNESRHLKCWGSNGYGQLGLGDTTNRYPNPSLEDVELGDGESPARVTCGLSFTCVLLETGKVKCWGKNHAGQLGQGTNSDIGRQPDEIKNLPTVDIDTHVLKLTVGWDHVCAFLATAEVKCWGNNSNGALGLDDPNGRDTNRPTKAVNIGCSVESCFENPCPEYSTCEVVKLEAKCVCKNNYINTNPLEESTLRYIPKFHARATLQTPEILKISVSKLVPNLPEIYYIGIEGYKLVSEFDLQPVKLFQGHRMLLTPYSSSPSNRLFGPLDPGSKYEIRLFPLKFDESSNELVRDGEYFEKLEVETICDCAKIIGDSQERLYASAYQVEGVVQFRFPDTTRCEDRYEVSRRIDGSSKNVYISAHAVEPGVCSTKYIEPDTLVSDDLRRSKLVVGETYKYDVIASSRHSSSLQHEPITIEHTVQWEASVLVNVTVPETSEPVAGVGIWYQLRSPQDEVISECDEDGQSTLSELWCQSVSKSDGTVHASFKVNHPSLTNDNEASIHIRFESGVLSGRCNSLTTDCGFDEGVVVKVKHLSFGVPVELSFSGTEAVNDPMIFIAAGGGILGSVLVISAIVVFGLKKKKRNTVAKIETPIGDIFDKNTNTFVPRQQQQ